MRRHRVLVQPLSNLMATGQVAFGDSVYVDKDASDKLVFSKHSDPALIDELQHLVRRLNNRPLRRPRWRLI